MFPFYVAALRGPNGTLRYAALCAGDDAQARETAAEMKRGAVVSVMRREEPRWAIVGPSQAQKVYRG